MVQHTMDAAMLWAVCAHLAAGGHARLSLVTFGVDAQDAATPAAAPFAHATTGEHASALPLYHFEAGALERLPGFKAFSLLHAL